MDEEKEEFIQYLLKALETLRGACQLSLARDENLKVSLIIEIEDKVVAIPIPPHAVFSVASSAAKEMLRDFRGDSDFRSKIPPHLLEALDAAFGGEKVFN